ncbi:hypothetical protein ACFY8O_33530 [Streptomyces argenteolus]|uniref:MFS transporter n=1 Tax=Streptomyces argenteolus TaxID=67274 RepID=A0ABW6XGL7_9ACTN
MNDESGGVMRSMGSWVIVLPVALWGAVYRWYDRTLIAVMSWLPLRADQDVPGRRAGGRRDGAPSARHRARALDPREA